MPPTFEPPTTLEKRRLRILVSAYGFSPVAGSEPGIGWNICSRLAAYHDVTVLTRSWNEELWAGDGRHREEAERFMRDIGQIPGLTIQFVDSPRLSRLLQPHPTVSLQSPFYFQGYAAWQRAAYREAVRLHREQPFDVAHQLTVTSFREPGYLWQLNVPFIWGPIGGGDNIPWSYLRTYGLRDRVYYGLKNISNRVHAWTKFRSRVAARHAECVLATSEHCVNLVTRWGGKPHLLLDTGTPNWTGIQRHYDGTRPLNLYWGGLHIARKAVPIALHALAELKRRGMGNRVHLTLAGDGPASSVWRRLSSRLQIDDMTTWLGQIPYQQISIEYGKADAFIMPSVQEGTSMVIMEALAAGLPVICHDISGLSIAVDETCGIKIPLLASEHSVRDFADAVAQIVSTRGLLDKLSNGALRRASALSWDVKVREITKVYAGALAVHG